MRHALWLAFSALAVFTGCIVQAPTKEGSQAVAPPPPPAPPVEVRNGANFADKVELVSVNLPPRLTAGSSVRIALNFKVLAPIDRDYSIFVHVEDAEGRVDRINVDHPPRLKPTTQWQPGEMVRDEFDVPVPAGMPVKGLNLILGLWDPKSDERMQVKNREAVRNDGHDRVFVATMQVLQP